jgi:hypothetical protein
MVDRRTGKETKLGGWPVLSPNRKRFVVTDTFATGECSADYNIAIFSLARDPPRLEWHYTADNDHEDYSIDAWDGENRVLMQGNGNGKDHPSDLKRTAQGWQLRLPDGQLTSGIPVSPAQANDQKSASQPANPVMIHRLGRPARWALVSVFARVRFGPDPASHRTLSSDIQDREYQNSRSLVRGRASKPTASAHDRTWMSFHVRGPGGGRGSICLYRFSFAAGMRNHRNRHSLIVPV